MRLDNSNPRVINMFGLSFDENDPGATPPVDVCLSCLITKINMEEVNYDIEHPDYEDGNYTCAICGFMLDYADNEF